MEGLLTIREQLLQRVISTVTWVPSVVTSIIIVQRRTAERIGDRAAVAQSLAALESTILDSPGATGVTRTVGMRGGTSIATCESTTKIMTLVIHLRVFSMVNGLLSDGGLCEALRALFILEITGEVSLKLLTMVDFPLSFLFFFALLMFTMR